MNMSDRRRWRPTSLTLRKLINERLRAETLAGQILSASSIDVFLRKAGEWRNLTGRTWQRLPTSRRVKAEVLAITAKEKRSA